MTTTPSPLSYTAIRDYAEQIGRHYGIYDEDGRADISSLLRKTGGETRIIDTTESMRVASRGDYVIFLPTHTSGRRDRFTQAHEIGHYFLHYVHMDRSGSETFNRGGRNLAETQANVFASSLLMPENRYREAFVACQGDYWQLAHRFDVSPAAAEVRAKVLNLAQ